MLSKARQGFIAGGVAALTVGVFLSDILTPRGLTNQVLYVIPLLLSFLSASTAFPLVVAGVCSLLILVGLVLSPDVFQIPLWVIASNRLFSLVVLWTPVLYYRQRRKHEEELMRMNEELEIRVQKRTKELASVNNALVAEVSERMQTEQSLESSRRELRQLASQLLRVQEEERRRISRDLHDDVNQRLALLAIEIEDLEQHLSSPTYQVSNALRGLHGRVAELSEDVRHLAYQYHPSILDDLGLPIAIQRLVDDFVARNNIEGTLTYADVPEVLPQPLATCLYRVTQESLNNVLRHAKASRIEIGLSRSRLGLTITITDNGVGFPSERSRNGFEGLGLLSMKERVALVDGTFSIESTVGKGTQVQATVPLMEEK